MGILIVLGVVAIGVIAFSSRASGLPSNTDGMNLRGVYSPAPGTNFNPLQPFSSTMVQTGLQGGSGVASAAVHQGASGGSFSPTEAAAMTGIIGAGVAIIGTLLAQHQARLRGATNENNAAVQIVPAFDSFIQNLVNLVNTGQVSKPQAASATAQFDQSLYQQLRSLVGAPGTSWSDVNGMNGACDKSCTVSCCLYYSDLGPPLSLIRYLLGDPSGKWGPGDPRLRGNVITVPAVASGKYSSYSRRSYTLTVGV